MKIRSVSANNRLKAFDVLTATGAYSFPYSKAAPSPSPVDSIDRLFVDAELAREAFTYVLASVRDGSIHLDQVLEHNQDPAYLRDALLYKLTIEAQKRVAASPLSKREIVRCLGTSPAQFYRLLDQTSYRKSVDRLLALLQVLDCEVDLVVRTRRPRVAA